MMGQSIQTNILQRGGGGNALKKGTLIVKGIHHRVTQGMDRRGMLTVTQREVCCLAEKSALGDYTLSGWEHRTRKLLRRLHCLQKQSSFAPFKMEILTM